MTSELLFVKFDVPTYSEFELFLAKLFGKKCVMCDDPNGDARITFYRFRGKIYITEWISYEHYSKGIAYSTPR